MTNIVLLFVCLLIGIGLRRIKLMPTDAHLALNTVILHVPLPAIALLTIPHLQWEISLLTLCLVPWIIFGVGYVLFPWLGRKFGWEKSVVGCLILTAGLGNTAFVGFPVIEALYGKEALKLALLLDQPGTFLIVSSMGIYVAALYSSGRMPKKELARKVILFPPFMAFVSAVILSLFGWSAQGEVKIILEKLAAVLTPLALISVGLQLKWGEIINEGKFLTIGLSYKLIVCPLMIFIIYRLIGLEEPLFKIAVMEAAMAPMITASIIAASHNLQPRLAGMMVGVGVPLSFITLTAWYFILS